MLDSDASSAKTLTLVAIILQSLFFIVGLIITITFLALFLGSTAGAGSVTASFPAVGLGLFGSVFAFGFAIGFIWILLEYFLVYKKLSEERVTEAETPALVLGVITLLFGGIITGILLIIAYVKIRDSIARHPPAYQHPYQQQPPPPSF